MPLRVRSPKGRLNFFSGRRDLESSRQSELSRAFVSHLESARIRKDHARVSVSSRANQYSDAGLRRSRRRHSSTRDLRNKWPDEKNFLAMSIQSDMKAGGESLGTISRNYEGVGSPSVYPYFERLLRPVLRGHGLPFQWIGSKRTADSQHTSCRGRHHYDSSWDVQLDWHTSLDQGDHTKRSNDQKR